MQIVQAVEKIPHVAAKHGQHSVIPVLANKVHKINAHLIHELAFRHSENLGEEKIVLILWR